MFFVKETKTMFIRMVLSLVKAWKIKICCCFISLHIRSMWETICDAWACWSGWKFGPNSTEYPYSEIQNTPPPPQIEI